MTWNAVEQKTFSNLSATPATFTLKGGQYGVMVNAASFGTVTLQRQSIDGSSFITCLTAFSANGYATVNLPNGTYQLTIATATGVYADITSIVVA